MKICEDVLAVILLDVINCFILAAPLLFSPPYVIVTPARTVVIPLLQFGVIALSVVRFRKKYPKLTAAQKKTQARFGLGLFALIWVVYVAVVWLC